MNYKKTQISALSYDIQKGKTVEQLINGFIRTNAITTTASLEHYLIDLKVFVLKNYNLTRGPSSDNLTRGHVPLPEDLTRGHVPLPEDLTRGHVPLLDQIKLRLKTLNITADLSKLDIIHTAIAQRIADSLQVKFVFDKIDVKTIENMQKSFYWTQKKHNLNIQNTIKKQITQAFKGKVPRAKLAGILDSKFNQVLGQNATYYQGVSDHIINQSQNITRIKQAVKYNVKHFKVIARLDDRTSAVCRSMHGRIIPADHLNRQADNMLEATTIEQKKQTAVWHNKPIYGKLSANFGVPPYHFRCRTQVVPVYLDSAVVDGKETNYYKKRPGDLLTHIDVTGKQRYANNNTFNHSETSRKRKRDLKGIVGALNTITAMAPQLNDSTTMVTKSANGYFMVLENDRIVTAFKPHNLRKKFNKKADLTQKFKVKKWKNTTSTSVMSTLLKGWTRLIKKLS